MGSEIDLMKNYPRSKRDVDNRGEKKTSKDREIARKFGKEFFDGSREHGYGGFFYNERFWSPVVPTFQRHFEIRPGDKILDVGCAKGFMLHDLKRLIPGVQVAGIDISAYAIDNAIETVKPYLQVADARSLPFEDDSFDFVFSITTLHNFVKDECAKSLKEVQRVAKKGSFVTLDAYRNDEEKLRMEAWNLTALTMMHVDEWKVFFQEVGYDGDYYWFIP
jgi:SAM-dependent methyltransferase